MTFDVGPFALRGTIPDANDGRADSVPRRTVLDSVLVSAAAESGVEIREVFTVDACCSTAMRWSACAAAARTDDASRGARPHVIGADGVNSFVARAVRAPEYDMSSRCRCAATTPISAASPQDDIELYVRDHCAFGGAPTNDGLHLVMVNWPTREFQRSAPISKRHVRRALEMSPDLLARVRQGRREEKWYGTAGVPEYFRKPYGKGWALVGDASYNRDPITAQGISDAFIDADMSRRRSAHGCRATGRSRTLMAGHEAARNERVRPMYEFTNQLAALEPPPAEMQALFGALRDNQDAPTLFFRRSPAPYRWLISCRRKTLAHRGGATQVHA